MGEMGRIRLAWLVGRDNISSSVSFFPPSNLEEFTHAHPKEVLETRRRRTAGPVRLLLPAKTLGASSVPIRVRLLSILADHPC
jgi:hypothetical protein